MDLINRFFSQAGDAWIDPPTNFTSIPGFDSGKAVKSLLDVAIPSDRAASYLHEMTHHWCFSSYVGIALTIVKQRILYNLAAIHLGRDIEEFDLLDDMIRYQATVELLRPLSEGLALFAEYDACPKGMHTYSIPLMQTFIFSGKEVQFPQESHRFVQAQDIDLFVRACFDNIRLSRKGIERKADLLASSFVASDSPYLSGYLATKTLWRIQQIKRGADINSDQFLSYLRTFFFSDFGLVEAILAPGHENDLFARIARYIHGRLDKLQKDDLTSAMQEWDEQEESDDFLELLELQPGGIVVPKLTYQPLLGLLVDPNANARGYELLLQHFRWLSHGDETHELLTALKSTGALQLCLRDLMPISAISVTTTEDRRVVAEDGTVFGPFQSVKEPLNGEYLLEYYQIPTNKTEHVPHFAVLIRNEDVAAFICQDSMVKVLDPIIPHIRSTGEQLARLRAFQRFEQDVRKSPSMEVIENVLRSYDFGGAITRNINSWYGAIASWIFQGHQWQAQMEITGSSGLLNFFDRDYSDMIRLAEYSLRASHVSPAKRIEPMFTDEKAHDAFYHRLAEVETQWQAQLHLRREMVEICYV